MSICSRGSIPACAVCDQPTMEPGTDDSPWATSYYGDRYVCSEPCELRDTLANAHPELEWMAILDAADRLRDDYADFREVRIHRPACTPVLGAVIDLGDDDVLLEDGNGDEVCVRLSMISRVEVVEGG